MKEPTRALLLGLSLVALSCCLVHRASAQSAAVEKPASAAPSPSRFSLGAGVGISYDGGGTGLAGSLIARGGSASAITPAGTALLEWAASPALRLMLGAVGRYTKQLHPKHEDKSLASSESQWSAGAGLGLRWVLNPGQVVEVSPALLLGVHGGRVTNYRTGETQSAFGSAPIAPRGTDSATLGVDGRLGLVLEYALLSSLYLRFECYFLRAGADWVGDRLHDEPATTTRRGEAGVGWGLAPSLQLRLVI